MRLRVVCGFGETIATFWPTSVFTRVDLPALGRPTIATKPDLNAIGCNDCTRMDVREEAGEQHAGRKSRLCRLRRGWGNRDDRASANAQHFALVSFDDFEAKTVGLDDFAGPRNVASQTIQQTRDCRRGRMLHTRIELHAE